MNYCSHCGQRVEQKIPEGDNRMRYACTSCESVHYQNPRLITGCIAEHQSKILLCKRAIKPRKGLWTLPAGFMENNETTLQAACRETFEEATAQLDDITLFCSYSIPHISQVFVIYRASLRNGMAEPGIESIETRLFSEQDIPWDNLAFPVMNETLKLYFQDKQNGRFLTHDGEIFKDKNQQLIVNNYSSGTNL